jgi:uncharacterized membrane protein
MGVVDGGIVARLIARDRWTARQRDPGRLRWPRRGGADQMTDPLDDTQTHATNPTNPTSPTSPTSPALPSADPTPAEPAPPVDSSPGSASTASTASNLRVDPDRPAASEWREPAWFPPRDKNRGPNLAALIGGFVLVAIGLYFFLDRTLGIAMPRVQWSTIWPVVLIVLGFVVLFRSVKRRS